MPFFKLPRELRDKIYHLYVFEPDGYYFDYESGKLRTSDNRPIDLNFIYTCKSIAVEMHHLALGSNVINFSTVKSQRLKAGQFYSLYHHTYLSKSVVLLPLSEPMFHHYLSPEIQANVTLRFPQFEYLLRLVFDDNPSRNWHPLRPGPYMNGHSWGEAHSSFRDFQDYLIELLSSQTDYPQALGLFYDKLSEAEEKKVPIYYRNMYNYDNGSQQCHNNLDLPHEQRSHDQHPGHEINYTTSLTWDRSWSDSAAILRSGHITSKLEPWSIPSDHELSQVNLPTNFGNDSSTWHRVKWRFSAAAAAIHFLRSTVPSARLGIKKVVLHEDRRSVPSSECHALGLIPFCKENLHLHVERRIDIWRVFPTAWLTDLTYNSNGESLQRIEDEVEFRRPIRKLIASYFGPTCSRWITEASVLFNNGMPADSFSLILDGDPAPEGAAQLFDIVKEDAAWQVAQLQWYTEESLSPGPYDKMSHGFYRSTVFPQAISDIIEGRSFIRCTFPTGEMYDPEIILNRNRHLTSVQANGDQPYGRWLHAHGSYIRRRTPVDPPPPMLPYFADYALEELLPRDSSEQPI